MAPNSDSDVELGCCPICELAVVDPSLLCSKCKLKVHLKCSLLPGYHLVNLLNSRTQYMCETCVKIKFVENYGSLVQKCERAMKAGMDGESRADSDSTAAAADVSTDSLDDSREPASGVQVMDLGGEPSAPTLSQLTAEQRTPPASRRLGGDQATARQSVVSVQEGEKSKKICFHYRRGTCKFGRRGQQCKYSHPNVCFKFKNFGVDKQRGCPPDASCDFMHPIICNRARRGITCSVPDCKFFHPKRLSKNTEIRNEPTQRPDRDYRPSLTNGPVAGKKTGVTKPSEVTYAQVASHERTTENYFLEKMTKDFQVLKQQMTQLTELVHGKLMSHPTCQGNPTYQWPPLPQQMRLI